MLKDIISNFIKMIFYHCGNQKIIRELKVKLNNCI